MELIRRKTDYSLRALVAISQADRPVRAEELAERGQTPIAFLHKALSDLAEARILEGQRGPGGGFTLARPAHKISLLDVIEALQGPLLVSNCLSENSDCTRKEACPQRHAWMQAQQGLEATLGGITLENLAALYAAPRPAQRPRAK